MTIPIQTINLGSYPNDGTGDDLRTAFTKVNTNFNTLFTEGAVIGGTNLGTGTHIFSGKNNTNLNLEFKTLTSDASVTITDTGTNVHLSSSTTLYNDPAPTLSQDLNLNGHNVVGGDTQTTVFGYDFNALNTIVSGQVASSRFKLDFGSMTNPTGYQTDSLRGYTLDLNGTGVINGFNNPLKNDYDFGALAVDNFVEVGGYKLTLNSNLTINNGHNVTFNTVGNTNLNLPTVGTLSTNANTLNQFSPTSSSQLLSVITDPTGIGKLVFNTDPILSGTVTARNISTSGYIYTSGNFAVNGTKFEVDAATGNTIIAGTLNIAGITTASGTLASTGNFSVNGTKFRVDSATGNVSVAGTLSTGIILSGIPAGDPQIDVSGPGNNRITLAIGGNVNFPNFSGSVMVNCWNSGTVTQYLCGSGSAPVAIGSSKVTPTGTMSSNSGINGYTFTATEAGVHTFYVIKTRPGA